MDQPPSATSKRPWPMKWIVLAIGVYVVGYTFINIAYRKPPDTAHEPYAEARERATRTVQTTMNGWARVACEFSESAPTSELAAVVTAQPLPEPLDRHLPPDLPLIMPGKPALHPAAMTISAPGRLAAADSLRVRLDLPEAAAVPAFGEILAYFKDAHLYVFIQDQRHVARDARPTPATSPIAIVVPPATLTAGTWQASVFTETQAFTWNFEVE